MNYENKIEETARMLLNLDFKDFVAVENVIDRMINSKKEKQHVIKISIKKRCVILIKSHTYKK